MAKELAMVTQACTPSTWKTEAGGFPQNKDKKGNEIFGNIYNQVAQVAHTYNPASRELTVMCHHASFMQFQGSNWSLMQTTQAIKQLKYSPAPILIFWMYEMKVRCFQL